MPKVAITGSNGFIGSSLVKKFYGAGWNVVALQKKEAASNERLKVVIFNINQKIDESELQELNLLIHCAWQPYTKKFPEADIINQQGTIKLQELAHRIGAKFIFISTLSAHTEAISHYGQSKFHTETLLDYSKDLTLKIGLVIGNNGGFFRKISPVLRKMKIIPLIGKGQQPVQTLDIDDLFMVIVKSFQKGLCGNFTVAESEPTRIIILYRLISEQLGTNPIFINIPYPLIYTVMQIAENFLPLPINTENLKGLKHYRAFDTTEIQKELDIQLLSANKSIEKVFKTDEARHET